MSDVQVGDTHDGLPVLAKKAHLVLLDLSGNGNKETMLIVKCLKTGEWINAGYGKDGWKLWRLYQDLLNRPKELEAGVKLLNKVKIGMGGFGIGRIR